MPARIVVADDDPEFVNNTVMALRGAGYDVAAFADSMSALAALEVAQLVEVLITGLEFPEGLPNGVSLGLMARLKRPGVNVLLRRRREEPDVYRGCGRVAAGVWDWLRNRGGGPQDACGVPATPRLSARGATLRSRNYSFLLLISNVIQILLMPLIMVGQNVHGDRELRQCGARLCVPRKGPRQLGATAGELHE